MTNHLSNENSPYLLQHAENPVDWYPWSDEALNKARQEDKPIFLSIGYAACHWCHVMAHESFEDDNIANYLNENFVSIKVDREERPDLDAVYMNAVTSITGQGGWPMSLFLTPEGKPFFGGTYFPPFPRYNMPAFMDVLELVIDSWRTERSSIETTGQRLIDHITSSVRWKIKEVPPIPGALDAAEDELLKNYDWQNGGWGRAPKFPQAMAIDFLLKKSTRANGPGLKAACHALDSMSQGGMYDLVGGGFHRYSTDADWLVPHFEKMLYDNALLAGAYLHAYLITGNQKYRKVCEATLDFILRDLSHPDGGFFSSLDADTLGEEGKTYTWSQSELAEVLGSRMNIFSQAFDISTRGNFFGSSILQRITNDDALASSTGIPPAEITSEISKGLEALFQARLGKPQPGVDDKILTGWNGLTLTALAEAGRYLGRSDYLDAARKNARSLTTHVLSGERLNRSWRDGSARHAGTLEDYASLGTGLLALYMADHNDRWYTTAVTLAEAIQEIFIDPEGGFFDSQADPSLPYRPKEYQDNATPSGNSLAVQLFLMLSDFSENSAYRVAAEKTISQVYTAACEYPTAFSFWLQAMDYASGPVAQIAVLGKSNDSASEFLGIINSKYEPRRILAYSKYPPPDSSPPLLKDRPLVQDHTTAYVCREFICNLPATSTAQLKQQLESPVAPD